MSLKFVDTSEVALAPFARLDSSTADNNVLHVVLTHVINNNIYLHMVLSQIINNSIYLHMQRVHMDTCNGEKMAIA